MTMRVAMMVMGSQNGSGIRGNGEMVSNYLMLIG